MNGQLQLIHEQFLEYDKQLKVLEKEIVRKIRAGENPFDEGSKAVGLKMMKEECIKMMARKC